MKKLIDLVVDRLCVYLEKKNMTQYRLAIKSGLPLSTVKSIMQRRTKDINLTTLYMICEGLGISVLEFLDDKSLLPENVDWE